MYSTLTKCFSVIILLLPFVTEASKGITVHDPYPKFLPATVAKSFFGGFEEANVSNLNNNLLKVINLKEKLLLVMIDENQFASFYTLKEKKLEKLSINTGIYINLEKGLSTPLPHVVLQNGSLAIKIYDNLFITDGTNNGTYRLKPEFPVKHFTYNNFWGSDDNNLLFKSFNNLHKIDIKSGKLINTTSEEDTHYPYMEISKGDKAILHNGVYEKGYDYIVYSSETVIRKFKSDEKLNDYFLTTDDNRLLLKFDEKLGLVEYFKESEIPTCNEQQVRVVIHSGITENQDEVFFAAQGGNSEKCLYSYNKLDKKVKHLTQLNYYTSHIISSTKNNVILLVNLKVSNFAENKYNYINFNTKTKEKALLYSNEGRDITYILTSESQILFHVKHRACSESCIEISKLDVNSFSATPISYRLRHTDPNPKFDPYSLLSAEYLNKTNNQKGNLYYFNYNNDFYLYGPFPMAGLYIEEDEANNIYWENIFNSKAYNRTMFISSKIVALGSDYISFGEAFINQNVQFVDYINSLGKYIRTNIKLNSNENIHWLKNKKINDEIFIYSPSSTIIRRVNNGGNSTSIDLSTHIDSITQGRYVFHENHLFYLSEKNNFKLNLFTESVEKINTLTGNTPRNHVSCGNSIFYNNTANVNENSKLFELDAQGNSNEVTIGRILYSGLSENSDNLLLTTEEGNVQYFNCIEKTIEKIFNNSDSQFLLRNNIHNIFYNSNYDTLYSTFNTLTKYNFKTKEVYTYPSTEADGVTLSPPKFYEDYSLIKLNNELYEITDKTLNKIRKTDLPDIYTEKYISTNDNRFGLLTTRDNDKTGSLLNLLIHDRLTDSIVDTKIKQTFNHELFELINNKFLVKGIYNGYKSSTIIIDPYCIVDNICEAEPGNRAPILSETFDLYFEKGDEISVGYRSTDEDLDTLSFSLDNAPEWLSISSDGVIKGMVPNDTNKFNNDISIIVNDGEVEARSKPFNIIIDNANNPEDEVSPEPPEPEPSSEQSSGGSLNLLTLLLLAFLTHLYKSQKVRVKSLINS